MSSKNAKKTDQIRAAREAAASAPPAPPSPKATLVGVPAPSAAAVAPESGPAATDTPAKAAYLLKRAERKAARKALGPAAVRAVQFKRAARMLDNLVARFRTWNPAYVAINGYNVDVVGAAREEALRAAKNATAAAGFLEKLPEGWQPARGKADLGSVDALAAGSIVSVREKYRGTYEGIVEPADLLGRTVVAVGKGGAISCKSASGERLIFPRSHLMLAEGASSAALLPAAESEPAA